MLRDDSKIHQLQAAGQGQRNGGAGNQRKGSGAAQRNPVVLDVESFFDEVDFFLGRIWRGRIRQT